MSTYRTGGGGRPREDDRNYYPAPPRAGGRDYDDFYEREERSAPPRSRAPVREYEDTEISIGRESRTPAFLREEPRRNEGAGQMVLRAREIETVDRRRPRSPSPVHVHERFIERERERERSPAPPSMAMERRPRFMERDRSPSPGTMVHIDRHEVVRRRERSPTPERERIRIIQREKEREPSPSPSPPPPAPPAVIRGPTIEREVITHYRDIDHGVIKVPSPPPPAPAPRPSRTRERETDIDIYTSGRGDTEVDITKRTRSRSRPAQRPRPQPVSKPSYYDDEVLVQSNRNRLHVDIDHGHRRAQSAAPERRPDFSDEADYITDKIDSRGRMGEAWNGATKDWSIIDVPPGTERVQMDGVGGGQAEVTWQRYNGVRRSKFIPEREGTVVSSASEPVSDRDRLSVQVYDSHRDKSRDRDIVEDIHDTRISIRDRDRPRRKKEQEMWTEITKDLVVREAIEKLGYEYEETEYFFYVMQYLRYEDVSELVTISDQIRRARRERAREIEWERESRDRWERRHRHRRSMGRDKYDDERERVVEHEVIYDRAPVRGYLR
ncbi:hypothetical protein PG996_005650 [Apiospora saccharicola]|uniref:DUF8035 domain-containing protein n=1 Tax=Apiospora saccharicola TaxID=335842 RepID=A0ABR1VM53_9PEZI